MATKEEKAAFFKSKESAKNLLLQKFGNNAVGICGVSWLGEDYGHCFNWEIRDGIPTFFDTQSPFLKKHKLNHAVDEYWSIMDPKGKLYLARLDNLELRSTSIDVYNKYFIKNRT